MADCHAVGNTGNRKHYYPQFRILLVNTVEFAERSFPKEAVLDKSHSHSLLAGENVKIIFPPGVPYGIAGLFVWPEVIEEPAVYPLLFCGDDDSPPCQADFPGHCVNPKRTAAAVAVNRLRHSLPPELQPVLTGTPCPVSGSTVRVFTHSCISFAEKRTARPIFL
jgi:hypothetical protein